MARTRPPWASGLFKKYGTGLDGHLPRFLASAVRSQLRNSYSMPFAPGRHHLNHLTSSPISRSNLVKKTVRTKPPRVLAGCIVRPGRVHNMTWLVVILSGQLARQARAQPCRIERCRIEAAGGVTGWEAG